MNAIPNTAPTTLPACARIHPDLPSQVIVTHCMTKAGTSFVRSVCTVCRSVAAKAQSRERAESARVGYQSALAGRLYGVTQLSWTPPELWSETT